MQQQRKARILAALGAVALVALPYLLSGATFPRAISPRPDLQPVVTSLAELRARLSIPGLAAAMVVDGEIVWRGNWGNLTTTSPRDIASVTKTMAAVIAMQEVEQGRLGLQDPAPGLPGVEVRHLLSHTSVGKPGTSFQYNNLRYGALTAILEQRTHQTFPQLMTSRVFAPAGMTSTRPGRNSISGVVSNVEDLARYMAALDGDQLVGDREKQWMWMPIGHGLPYALGWYSQSYNGRRVVWHYGQLNGYGSSLVIKIPALRANLVVLSNSSLLSDAYHLESGDITRSPLGRSFLAAMVDPLPLESMAPPARMSELSAAGDNAQFDTPAVAAKPAQLKNIAPKAPKQITRRRVPHRRTIVHGAGL